MSSTLVRGETVFGKQEGRGVDLKLEVVVIPVSDVERAKRFYAGLGWRVDAEFRQGNAFHVLQFTPPGSPCSIHIGTGLTPAAPGSAQSFLVVSDIEAARDELLGRGVAVGEVFHRLPGGPGGSGPDPERRTYASYASFKDPDGNGWLLQEVTARLPGRVDGNEARFTSAPELAAALRRAAAAHGEHEKRNGGKHDENWPVWYAEYMLAEQTGRQLPT